MNRFFVLVKESVLAFVADDALSRGASISFYAVTSLVPVIVIVAAIAGMLFDEEAARGQVAAAVGGLMGPDSAAFLQSAITKVAAAKSSGFATAAGLMALVITASGVFGEVQAALNAIWKASPKGTPMARLVRARLLSLALVTGMGLLLLVSLLASAALTSVGKYLGSGIPAAVAALAAVNFAVSFVLLSFFFSAIYRVLPDTDISWRDVAVGGIVTALLSEIGKSLIALYIGTSATASAYGAAGTMLVVLLWIYYSVQIFLLGAEFTRVYSRKRP